LGSTTKNTKVFTTKNTKDTKKEGHEEETQIGFLRGLFFFVSFVFFVVECFVSFVVSIPATS
jgi:hypothetical protein